MVQISREEAQIVRKKLPKLHMMRTVNKYYVESSPELFKILGIDGRRKDVKSAC